MSFPGPDDVMKGSRHILDGMCVDKACVVFTCDNLRGPTGEVLASGVCIAVACDTDFGRQFLPSLDVEEQERFIESSSSTNSKLARKGKMLLKRIQELESLMQQMGGSTNVQQGKLKGMEDLANVQQGKLQEMEEKVNILEENDRKLELKAKSSKEEIENLEEENRKLKLQCEANAEELVVLSSKLEEQNALRLMAFQKLEVRQADLELKLDENNGFVKTIMKLSLMVSELEHLRPVALRKFFEIARWKIHSFLVSQGCQELWLDKGWNYLGWNKMVLGIGQSVHWRELLLTHGVSMDALHLLRYGAGSLQSQGSDAAHAGIEMGDNLDVETAQGYIKAYAKCISVLQKNETRKLLNSLFEFCFNAGEYLNFT